MDLSSLVSPVSVLFIAIILGGLVGRIKVFGIFHFIFTYRTSKVSFLRFNSCPILIFNTFYDDIFCALCDNIGTLVNAERYLRSLM